MNLRNVFLFAALLPALGPIFGCGTKQDAKTPTQVAAKVNSDEITVHQVNYFLSRNQNITPEGAPKAKREILDKLIDQELAKQKAIENKLDRSPNVVQAIEAAKNEILARAYLEQIATALPAPASWEIQKYYEEHPELFAQRRIFDLEEFIFVAEGEDVTELRARFSKASSMNEIADWLKSREIRFVANRSMRAAEQIPIVILPKLQAMKSGEIKLFEADGNHFQVIRVVAFTVEPVDMATATPRIRQFLLNRRSSEYIASQMKQIKEQATIEYLGEFAGGGTGSEPRVDADSGIKAKIEARSGPEQPRSLE